MCFKFRFSSMKTSSSSLLLAIFGLAVKVSAESFRNYQGSISGMALSAPYKTLQISSRCQCANICSVDPKCTAFSVSKDIQSSECLISYEATFQTSSFSDKPYSFVFCKQGCKEKKVCLQPGDECVNVNEYKYHSSSCAKYLVCTEAGIYLEMPCASGTFFNLELKTCVHEALEIRECTCL